MIATSPADALSSAAETSVVALACAGDRFAFDELVRRRQSNVRNILRRLCRDSALADDLAQEVFLQAWKRLSSLRSAGAFGGWLRQIAVNTWMQHARGSESFASIDDLQESEVAVTLSEQLDLDGALRTLTPNVRLCVVLAYHEGLSHGEIASLTRIPLGTVKSHITRGAARLRELLAAYDSSNERQTHAR